jgi:hypothetical protein
MKSFKSNYQKYLKQHKQYMKEHAWLSHYYDAKRRCTKPNRKDYPRYGGKGIEFLMTPNDFKYLWFRDRAYLMKTPSIDRIDNKGNYELANCRFIEHIENGALSKRKIILQKSIFGTKIRIWKSIKSIHDILGHDLSNLSEAIRDHRIAYGFKWEIYNEEV